MRPARGREPVVRGGRGVDQRRSRCRSGRRAGLRAQARGPSGSAPRLPRSRWVPGCGVMGGAARAQRRCRAAPPDRGVSGDVARNGVPCCGGWGLSRSSREERASRRRVRPSPAWDDVRERPTPASALSQCGISGSEGRHPARRRRRLARHHRDDRSGRPEREPAGSRWGRPHLSDSGSASPVRGSADPGGHCNSRSASCSVGLAKASVCGGGR